MLPKENRLRDRLAFERLKRRGMKVQTPLFTLLFFDRQKDTATRLGVITSVKFDSKATVRNLVRRKLMAASALALPQIKRGFDVCFIPQKEIIEKEFEEIVSAVKVALGKAAII